MIKSFSSVPAFKKMLNEARPPTGGAVRDKNIMPEIKKPKPEKPLGFSIRKTEKGYCLFFRTPEKNKLIRKSKIKKDLIICMEQIQERENAPNTR